MDISTLSQKQAAALLTVTPRTLRDWQAEDAAIPRNGDGTYPGPELIQWWFSKQAGSELDLNAERARLAKAQADKTEIEVAVRAGELAPVADIANWYGDHIERCRSRLIQVPDAVGQFCDPRTAPIIVAEIRRLLYEAMAELAEGTPRGRDEGAESVDAPADTDGERVGGRQSKALKRVERGAGPVEN